MRKERHFGAVLQVEVSEAITADVAAEQGRVGRLAYTAQQNDLEAGKLLDQVLADGRVTPDEVPLLKRASRHVHRSAEGDQRITEALA